MTKDLLFAAGVTAAFLHAVALAFYVALRIHRRRVRRLTDAIRRRGRIRVLQDNVCPCCRRPFDGH